MKKILIIHLGEGEMLLPVTFLDQDVEVRRIGCGGDVARARALIAEYDGVVDAIGLEGMPAVLRLGSAQAQHAVGAELPAVARVTPVVDGSGVRPELERWGVILAERAHPLIFNHKRVLFVPGVNHEGLAQALARRSSAIRFADPQLFFGLPDAPGVGSAQTLDQAAAPTLEALKEASFETIAGITGAPHHQGSFVWADILAGNIAAIRRFAPERLDRKMVIVESASDEDIADLRERGVETLITLMPSLQGKGEIARYPAATIEALLVALRPDPQAPLTEDTYLDLLADLDWAPAVVTLQPEAAGVNKFAFVIHPLSVRFIHDYPPFYWTRYVPDTIVEAAAAYVPPIYVGKITGGRSPTTGQRIEGYLISLGATPRQMMKHSPRFTYNLLNQAAHLAERLGARIMGLGAFTSVVGDAGITVANEADIAITSGNSLTVAATLETAKIAARMMGYHDLSRGRIMVIGATGSIGSACARLAAQATKDVVLVSIEPEKLIDLKRLIERETPGARVVIATHANDLAGECDLIITATSAFGQRVLDVTECKPGAIICDVARPPDINPAEAALRPDVLVIESGEVLIPGDVEIGYDIGLPPKTVYACLAETSLLAMEGRFEDYTLGRNISPEQVKEIYRLFRKHGYRLAPLRSFEEYITEEQIMHKRRLAEELRADPELFARRKAEAKERLKSIPEMAKGVRAARRGKHSAAWGWAGVGAVALSLIALRRQGRMQ